MMMKGENREGRKSRRQFLATVGLAIFLTLTPAIIAYAAVVFQRPVNSGPGSGFGMRMHPIKKTMRPHKGTDYPVPTGTNVNIGQGVTGMECKSDPDGYGSYAVVNYECNVQAKYAHLSKCDASSRTVISGNSGGSTGPHLHFEILLGGAVVSAEEAYGKDLCDPAVREELIKSANEKLNGQAGKDGAVAPVKDGAGSSTYVPPGSGGGGTIPDGAGGTITLPPGGGYYIIEDEDGRITIIADPNVDNHLPTLPPGTPPDLTPDTETDNEVTGCATDTWTAMVNQSVLQTRREMIANQTYIAKPDSVMAYACLTEHIKAVREDLGPIFSETKRWVNVEVDLMPKIVTLNKELGEYSLDGAITNVALTPYESWLRSNFSHDFLGGTAESGGEGASHEGHLHVEDQAYTGCGEMAQVWKLAKCKNVDEEQMFYKFEDLISNDPRKYPERYECNNTGITQAQIDTAKGKEVKFDKVDSYLDLLYPGKGGTCAPAVKTGVTVITKKLGATPPPQNCPPGTESYGCGSSGGGQQGQDNDRISQEETYPDALCLTIGCSYDKESGKCVVK